MKRNLSTVITDHLDDPVVINNVELTLYDVVIGALVQQAPQNAKAIEAGALAIKIGSNKELDIEAAEIALIEERLANVWGPVIVQRAKMLLNA